MSFENKALAVGLGGVGVTAVTALLPLGFPKAPKEFVWVGILMGMACICCGIFLFFRRGDTESLQAMSRTALQSRALKLANVVRIRDAEERARSHDLLMKQHYNRSKSTNDTWVQDNLEEHKARGAWQADFQAKYRFHMIAMCNEISTRLGLYPPYDDRPNALDEGMFA
jgi:hypothetical protein